MSIHWQFGNARDIDSKVFFFDLRLGSNCYVNGLTVHNGGFCFVSRRLFVRLDRIL